MFIKVELTLNSVLSDDIWEINRLGLEDSPTNFLKKLYLDVTSPDSNPRFLISWIGSISIMGS